MKIRLDLITYNGYRLESFDSQWKGLEMKDEDDIPQEVIDNAHNLLNDCASSHRYTLTLVNRETNQPIVGFCFVKQPNKKYEVRRFEPEKD